MALFMEELICLVYQFPVLYNINHPDYARTKLKDEIWRSIGEKLHLPGSDVKSKWLKLRECHREALRRQKKKPTGQRRDYSRPWLYQKQMEFLLPFMKNRSTLNEEESLEMDSPIEDHFLSSEIEAKDEDPEKLSNKIETERTENKFKKGISFPERKGIGNNEITPGKMSIKPLPFEYIMRRRLEERLEERTKCHEEPRQKIMAENRVPIVDDALNQFFMAMYSATKELPVYYQRQIRNKIFHAISQTEEEYESQKSGNGNNAQTTIPAFNLMQQVPEKKDVCSSSRSGSDCDSPMSAISYP